MSRSEQTRRVRTWTLLLLGLWLVSGFHDSVAQQPERARRDNVERLIVELRSPDRNVRRRANTTVRQLGPLDRDGVPLILEALNWSDRNTRATLISALTHIGPAAVPRLVEAVDDSDNLNVRLGAITALGNIHAVPKLSIAVLVRASSDENTAIRRASMNALSHFGSDARAAVRALARAVNDADNGVRTAALKTIATLGPTAVESTPTLLMAIRDEDPSISRLASVAIRKVGVTTERAVDSLIEATKESDAHVRRNAVAVLGSVSDFQPRAMPRLLELLTDDDENIVRETILTVGEYGPNASAAVPLLAEATKSQNRVVRTLAENSLRKLDPERASQLLGKPFDAVQARLDDIQAFQVGKQDWPQLGGSRFRNNTPSGTNIPATWNPGKFDRKTGEWIRDEAVNIKWVARLGSQSWGNPVVANGHIYVGTNNGAGYLKRFPSDVDLGCLLCFRESDGKFLWQHSSKKLATGRVHDWPLQGICSSPVIEGDRLWFVTNRGEVVCLDTQGFYDDEDDGPVTGVWTPLFAAPTTLNELKNLPPDGRGASNSLLRTIARTIRAVGLESRTYVRLKGEQAPGAFAVFNYSNQPTICRIAYADDSFKVLTAAEGKLLLDVNTDLLEGLDQGKVSPVLAAQFRGSGVSMEDLPTVRVEEPGWSWTITIDGESRREFRLTRKEQEIACEEYITPALKNEADVVWSFNMMKELGVSQHNMATCAPTIWGDTLFICTSNGVDESHKNIPAPEAPSFMAMNKHTGEVLWTDNSPGKNILHGQWSCPAVGVFDGVPQVIFPGGDGWLYSFRADRWKDGKPELLWKFDANPKTSKWVLGGVGTRNNLIAVPVIYDGLLYVAVGQDPEHGEGEGRLWCIDPTKRGDVSPELVVDDRGRTVPHRREQAAVEWERIGQANSKIWDGLDEGSLSEPIQKMMQQAGYKLPNDARLTTTAPGKQWVVVAKIDGVEQQFRIVADSYILSGRERHTLQVHRKTSETVKPNPNSAVVWHYDKFDHDGDGEIDFEEELHRSIGSPVIKNDLLMIADFSGLFHCVDAKTGIPYWTCDLLAAVWATPLIVEDKVFVGDEDGDVAIFGLSADPSRFTEESTDPDWDGLMPVHEINMLNSVYTAPIVVNNVLYIANRTHLFAIEKIGNSVCLPQFLNEERRPAGRSRQPSDWRDKLAAACSCRPELRQGDRQCRPNPAELLTCGRSRGEESTSSQDDGSG